MKFPIDLYSYEPIILDKLNLNKNISLLRDAIIFMTAYSGAKGQGGHTGGAYDIVPEILIIDGFIKGDNDVYPVLFDEAGHRVAIQYIMSALNGHIPIENLLHYRDYGAGLPGHPEGDITPGINFSSGRLGHLWSFINGIALANPDKKFVIFGSDGSQQEGCDAEAARFAVANNINITLIIDNNDITISGRPSKYMKGFILEKTLKGHNLNVNTGDGEDFESLYDRIRNALIEDGPVALINNRVIAHGVSGIENSTKGHDVIPFEYAMEYLNNRGQNKAVKMLEEIKSQTKIEKEKRKAVYLGSSDKTGKNRDDFGKIVCEIIEKMEKEERKKRVMVIDTDLKGSCGIHHIEKQFPEVFYTGGVMERNNFSVACGFSKMEGKQAIFATFSAFLEMVISEITMARLNGANVLAHFSHSGVDYIADNTSHFGTSIFFADNGLSENDKTRLYFPADPHQMRAIVENIFFDSGMKFIFSTRSPVPFILKQDGSEYFSTQNGYKFIPGKDEIIREGSAGYIISYGEMLYRALNVVEMLNQKNIDIGLINKPTLNIVDEEIISKAGKSPAVLVVESQNIKTGLGIRYGTWLLERGYNPKYAYLGVIRPGNGGIDEHMKHQGIDPESIQKKVLSLIEE